MILRYMSFNMMFELFLKASCVAACQVKKEVELLDQICSKIDKMNYKKSLSPACWLH